jgi:hypothetical protein
MSESMQRSQEHSGGGTHFTVDGLARESNRRFSAPEIYRSLNGAGGGNCQRLPAEDRITERVGAEQLANVLGLACQATGTPEVQPRLS